MTINELGQTIGDSVPDWKPPPMPSRSSLTGRYCTVDPLDPERHAAQLWAANAHDTDGRLWTYLTHGPYSARADYLDWVQRVAATADPRFFAVIDTRSKQAVGVAAYLRIDSAAGSIEVGHIHFSPLMQRTPMATEAMYLMMQRAFDLGYRRYEWKCDALNAPSRTAAARLGLSFEGVFRQAAVYKGRSRDTAWYAAIDGEWPALKEAFERWLSPGNFDADGRQRLRLSDLTAPVLARRG